MVLVMINNIKTKIKTFANIIITNFHNKKMSKEKLSCKCLSMIMIYNNDAIS